MNPDDEKENDSIYGKPSTKHRLTNHSVRRFMLQKLDDKGVEHNHIKQVTMIFSSYLYVNTSVWSLHVNGNIQNHGVTLTFVTINPMNRSCLYAYLQFGV